MFVWLGVFFMQFIVLNTIAASRHFLPDGDDMKFYNDWAKRILGGQFTDGKAFYGLPGYAYALAGIYKASGGYSHWYSPYLVGQLQAALHALTATWLFLLARRTFGGEAPDEKRRGTAIGVLAAAAWACFTPAQVFSAILMPTAWVVCAYWGMVYWLVLVHGRRTASWWRPWLWMGLLAGISAMMVATILMLLPLAVVAIALTVGRGNPLRGRLLPVAAAVVVLMAGVYAGCAPVWIHNYFIAKDRVLLSAHDGLNFYLGNHATSNGYTKIPTGLRASQEGLLKDSLTIPEKMAGHPLKRSEASAFWKEKGKAFIREQPVAWMRLLWRKFENFWNAFQYDDLSILKLLHDEKAVPPGLRFGFAAALGLPALLLCWRRWPRSRWVAGGVLLHMAALMPVFITERYRLAAAPGLMLLAAAGLWLLWENITARSWDKVALQFALTAVCAWFVSQPQRDIGLWSLDFYKAGIRATEGRTEALAQNEAKLAAAYLGSARRNLETAYAYVPNNPDITFALGNVWYYNRDNARAKLCFERAIRLGAAAGQPHDGALNNLGVIALTEKRPKDAELLFQRSIQAEPGDAKTWSLLAEACRDQGDIAHAEIAITQAIKLDGKEAAFQKFRDDLRKPAPAPAPK
jgi:tetratricopeptide (TPR) repeat protein